MNLNSFAASMFRASGLKMPPLTALQGRVKKYVDGLENAKVASDDLQSRRIIDGVMYALCAAMVIRMKSAQTEFEGMGPGPESGLAVNYHCEVDAVDVAAKNAAIELFLQNVEPEELAAGTFPEWESKLVAALVAAIS